MDSTIIQNSQNPFHLQKRLKNDQKFQIFQNFHINSKKFLDIVGVITISKLSVLSTFQGGL